MSNASLGKQTERGAETGIELHDQRNEPWQDAEWQRLWLAVESKPWRSLALVPAGDGASADFTLVIALTLSRTGMVHIGGPLQVADATQITLRQLAAFSNEVKRYTDSGQRLLVALPSIVENAITASIVQSVDAAVLCVTRRDPPLLPPRMAGPYASFVRRQWQ